MREQNNKRVGEKHNYICRHFQNM